MIFRKHIDGYGDEPPFHCTSLYLMHCNIYIAYLYELF